MTGRGQVSRREWLRAVGAAGAMFPWLRPRGARAQEARPRPRLVLLMQSNGTSQGTFWPVAGGAAPLSSPALSSPILDPIALDAGLAPRTTVLRGLFNDAGGAGNQHDFGFAGLYSGYRTVGTGADPWGNGPSLDQTLRRTLTFDEPFPTLNCGVLASDSPTVKAHRRSFSYLAARQPVPTEVDPYKLYAQFFPGSASEAGGDPVAAAKRRLRRKQTVMDYVAGDLRALRARAPRFDRERLDAHEASLRQLERRLEATLLPDGGRPARCGGARRPADGLDVTAEDNVPLLVPIMFDFLALALTCQLTRIVTFQFGQGAENWFFRWLGINEASHPLVHRDDGTNADVTAKIVKMNVWYAGLVARLARALNAVAEPGGTALDNSLIVWGNEQANGIHGLADIPVVLLGSAGGRLGRTGMLVSNGPQDYRRLGTTLLNVMGVPAVGFGEAPACGGIRGLDL